MRLYRDFHSLPPDARGCVVALGNFDGVHRGHQAVIGAAREIARRDGRRLAVLTFEPHPRTLFDPEAPPFRLTPLRPKLRLLAGLGVEVALIMRFTRALSLMSAETFAHDVLAGQLAAHHVVVGYDYVFGHQRRGTPELLGGLANDGRFAFTCVEPVTGEGSPEALSSTLVRSHLRAGAPDKAADILGREWEIEGRVRRGRRLGHTIGVPTANVALGSYLRPAFGVYACRAAVESPAGPRWIDAVANIGTRPTVDGHSELLEVHLLDFAGELYGRRLRVSLMAHLRGEVRFDGLPALQAQIARDIAQARALLADGAVIAG